MLEIKDLYISIAEKEILKGVSLIIENGQVHALMGPNGSGKSTLAQTLMGHPAYSVDRGSVLFEGVNILEMEPQKRAHAGIFLSFQHPSEIPGVSISNFLRMIYIRATREWKAELPNNRFGQNVSPIAFRKILKEKMEFLDMKEEFMHRYLNEGFSGGEKKRMEMLQMMVLEPKLAILDETDSGLDIDALKLVAKAVKFLKEKNEMAALVITHYTRIIKHLEPDVVHILRDGQIVQTGGMSLAHELEEKGYKNIS